jgi:hypothetical protein
MPQASDPATKPASYTLEMLDVIRSQIAPEDVALKEARERRDATRDVADKFGSTNRSFASGSLAHRTANCPVHQRDVGLDADCGIVLDRRAYPTLGPDSPPRWSRTGQSRLRPVVTPGRWETSR